MIQDRDDTRSKGNSPFEERSQGANSLSAHHQLFRVVTIPGRLSWSPLLRRRPDGFRVLTGEDALYYEALTDGADGATLLSAHIETATFAAVRTLLREGKPEAARLRWESVAGLTKLLFAEPSPAAAKYWLVRSGLIDSAEVRLPMVEVSDELAKRLDAEIERRVSLNGSQRNERTLAR